MNMFFNNSIVTFFDYVHLIDVLAYFASERGISDKSVPLHLEVVP